MPKLQAWANIHLCAEFQTSTPLFKVFLIRNVSQCGLVIDWEFICLHWKLICNVVALTSVNWRNKSWMWYLVMKSKEVIKSWIGLPWELDYPPLHQEQRASSCYVPMRDVGSLQPGRKYSSDPSCTATVISDCQPPALWYMFTSCLVSLSFALRASLISSQCSTVYSLSDSHLWSNWDT